VKGKYFSIHVFLTEQKISHNFRSDKTKRNTISPKAKSIKSSGCFVHVSNVRKRIFRFSKHTAPTKFSLEALAGKKFDEILF